MANQEKELLNLNLNIDDDNFDLESGFKDSFEKELFVLETDLKDSDDDFFSEFNKPSRVERKKTKQERLHEYKKINTKLPPELHRMLKTYCGQMDAKKNDIFRESLARFMNKNHDDVSIVYSDKINGKQINLEIDNKDKRAYNFEVDKEFFKQIKTFASIREIKMVQLYEQAIIDYLHDKRFSI